MCLFYVVKLYYYLLDRLLFDGLEFLFKKLFHDGTKSEWIIKEAIVSTFWETNKTGIRD